MHSGSDDVLEFVRARESEWRWWDNPKIARPMVSIVAVSSTDTLEAARPESGSMLRVRCAWENTPQGLLKTPLAELIRLKVDGNVVQTTLVSPERQNGLRGDHYHRWTIANLPPGKHAATADVRVLATKAEMSRTVEFSV